MDIDLLLQEAKELFLMGRNKSEIYSLLLNSKDKMFDDLVMDCKFNYSVSTLLGNDNIKKRIELLANENNTSIRLIAKDLLKKNSKMQANISENYIDPIEDDLKTYVNKESEKECYTDFNGYFMITRINTFDKNHFSSNIKFYFSISYDKITEFFKEYQRFAYTNNMDIYLKTRFEKASDMVTLRISDINHLEETINMIKKYNDKDNNNPLISTEDGIGYTLDIGASYNEFLKDLIWDYVSSNNEVSKEGFINFINDKKEKVPYPNFNTLSSKERQKDAEYVHFLNLEDFINNNSFSLDNFISKYKKLLEREKYTIYINNSLIKTLSKIGEENPIKMEEEIKNIINNNSTFTIDDTDISSDELFITLFGSKENAILEINKKCYETLNITKEFSQRRLDITIKNYLERLITTFALNNKDNNNFILEDNIYNVLNNDKVIYKTSDGLDMSINDLCKYYIEKNEETNNLSEYLFNCSRELIDNYKSYKLNLDKIIDYYGYNEDAISDLLDTVLYNFLEDIELEKYNNTYLKNLDKNKMLKALVLAANEIEIDVKDIDMNRLDDYKELYIDNLTNTRENSR